ncbi:MAG: hypothetical protein BGO49_01805 [Planctomycetales bacterium 71-10]|nr:MAG: hypothetical protein BGO49_01805 [Planctomycetales bacterium 71-10]
MFKFQAQPRKSRKPGLAVDTLEDRRVLSAGMGSTFAIVPGTVAEANKVSTVDVKLDSTHFTAGNRGRITLGIDVAADPSSSVKPVVSAIKSANGRNVAFQHSRYSQALVKAQGMGTPLSSAVTTTVQLPKAGKGPAAYQVQVKGATADTGGYLLGFYLPGDVDGDGVVSKDDVAAIASKFGRSSTDDGYSFDADANRDGKIDAKDVRMAGQNIGARTTISPVTSVNLDPASDTGISDRVTDQRNVKFTGAASPDATITFTEIDGKSPGGSTTVGADGQYSIDVPLGDGSNTFKVTTADAFGQSISGGIAAVTYSTNPPKVVNTIPTKAT